MDVIKDEPAGLDGNTIEDEPAGLDGDVNKDDSAGLDGYVIKDEPAGLDEDINKDEPAGLDGNVIKDKPAGLDGNVKKEGGAGRDNQVKAEGAGRSRGVKKSTRRVKVNMGGEELNPYRDTGTNIAIITPAMYRQNMGKVVAAKRYLRARGSSGYLDTKGMFKTTLTTASGASKRTWVYVVARARPDPGRPQR